MAYFTESYNITTKLNHIKSVLRESIEIASKATDGPWGVNQLTQMFFDGKSSSPPMAIQRHYVEGEQTFAEPFRGWCSYADAKFLAHARTMTPLTCKALLTAIEGLEQTLVGIGNTDDRMSDENSFIVNGIGDLVEKTLSSITSEWPEV